MKNNQEIMVSVNCITYNHEKYIRRSIESFLMQKTDFEFEILIHDDCSTDKTPQIVKEYEKRYPQIIKVIYEKENQYSKGKKLIPINYKNAKGKYIAFCEGDDYWTDPYKLQKQVDFMEKNPSYSLCTHSAITVNGMGEKKDRIIRPSNGNKVFDTNEIIVKDGGLFPSNSMLYRLELVRNMPDFYLNAPVEDYPLAIYLSILGKVYNFDEIMSAYRVEAMGSWSEHMKKDIGYFVSQKAKVINMLRDINCFTNFKFNECIEERIFYTMLDKAQQLKVVLPIRKRIKYIFDCKKLTMIRKIKYCYVLLGINDFIKKNK